MAKLNKKEQQVELFEGAAVADLTDFLKHVEDYAERQINKSNPVRFGEVVHTCQTPYEYHLEMFQKEIVNHLERFRGGKWDVEFDLVDLKFKPIQLRDFNKRWVAKF